MTHPTVRPQAFPTLPEGHYLVQYPQGSYNDGMEPTSASGSGVDNVPTKQVILDKQILSAIQTGIAVVVILDYTHIASVLTMNTQFLTIYPLGGLTLLVLQLLWLLIPWILKKREWCDFFMFFI